MLNWTRRMRISIYRPAKLRPHGSVCTPFWILTVEWSGARSCLFVVTSPFSDSIVFPVHTWKQRFQIAPLWRAFSSGSVFGDRFRRCSVDDSRIRSKTAPFSFENGLVWTGPYFAEGGKKMYNNLQCTCTAIVSFIKSFVWRGSRCRRRFGLCKSQEWRDNISVPEETSSLL